MKTPQMKINLLPREIRDQRKYELWYPWIGSATAILLVSLAIIFAISAIVLSGQLDLLDSTKAQVAATESEAGKLKRYEDEKKLFEARDKVVRGALSNRLDPYLLAVTVSKYLPANAWLSQLTFDAESGFSTAGIIEDVKDNPTTKDWQGVAGALDSLESSALLRNAWMTLGEMNDSPASGTDGSTSSDVVDQFTISAEMMLTLDVGAAPLWTSSEAVAQ